MIPIGTVTPFGEVVGIIWLGERYYFLVKNGVVSLLPADTVEPKR
jgi:hypothetical protein